VYWPFIQQWRQWVAAGRLGEIFYAECEYLHPIPDQIVDAATGRPLWRTTRAPLHYCSHSLGPILHILGDRITRAMGIGQGHRLLPAGGEGGIDIQVGLFQTAGGVIIKLLRSSIAPREPRMHFYSLQGTRGFVETDRLGPAGKGWLHVEGEMDKAQSIDCPFADASLGPRALAGGYSTGEYCVVEAFLAALETGRPPALGLTAAMDMTVPGLIAHQSALAGGIWLDVPQID
jgi:predicted dehydrogenase